MVSAGRLGAIECPDRRSAAAGCAVAASDSRLRGRLIGHAEDLAGNHQFETHDLVQRQHTDDHRGCILMKFGHLATGIRWRLCGSVAVCHEGTGSNDR